MEESDETLTEIFVEDPLITQHKKICTSWGTGNKLIACVKGSDRDRHTADLPLLLHEVQWNIDMHYETSRKLLNESNQIFLEVQHYQAEIAKENTHNPKLVQFSRNYRSVLRACLLELKSKLEDTDIDDHSYVQQQIQLYSMMELIWSLCEILFIENGSELIVFRLVDWCKWHFTMADELCQKCVSDDEPHLNKSYWDAILCLVLQGRIEESRNMLHYHPNFQTQVYDAFSSIDELLRKMPYYSCSQGHSVGEFEIKWNHWQEECARRLNDGDFDSCEEINTICRVLSGDDDIFLNVRELCGGWYQAMVSYLLYTAPTVSITNLYHHSKRSIELFGDRNQQGTFDDILLAAFELNPYQVIMKCSQQFSNWWLSTHLADLFFYSGSLSQRKQDFGIGLRDFLILEYSNCLMSNESFWRIVMDYLSSCSESGRHHLLAFVQRIPLTSERKVSKLIRYCSKKGLHAEAQSICRQMALSSLKSNQLGKALIWSLKCNDSAMVVKVAEKMLNEYISIGKFLHVDLLDYLGPSILISERLTFLGKYRDFHKLYESGKFKDAGQLLLNLFGSNIAPHEFWPPLMMDSLTLLEADEIVFNGQATAKLMSCLNVVNQTQMVKSDATTVEKEDQQKKMDVLRLALARNFARALVCQND